MIYQRDKIINSGSETMYRHISDPLELLLEYHLIALDALKSGAGTSDEFNCGGLEAECGVRYCILIIASDRFGGTETKFLYDVTRDLSVAETLLKTFCEGAVTPCSAKYIIEDIL